MGSGAKETATPGKNYLKDAYEEASTGLKNAGDAIARATSPVVSPIGKFARDGRDSISKTLGFTKDSWHAWGAGAEPEPVTTLAEPNPLQELFQKLIGGFCIPCQAKAAQAA